MKKLLFFILFSLSFYAQNDSTTVAKPNLSLIGLNKLNVVYKGIPNPISVNVKEAKPYKVKGEYVFQNLDGTYALQPKKGSDTKVVVEIETSDSTKVTEEHTFRVKDLPYAALLVNNKGCINGDCVIEMPGKELLNAEVTVKLIDYLLDYNISVTGFRVNLTSSNGDFLDSFEVKGNKIPQDVYDAIAANNKASLIIIHKFTFASDLNLSIAKTPVVKIRKV
ncbi:GldM family protein [Flavobacterium sp. H122]|uniref:GldM family protein n=1 Tax=Flavobacterium sp. H122 TaxID=2529860 RepID=UPI0010A9F76C|nr:GldM family protein [Flavobacterium sp. H122]